MRGFNITSRVIGCVLAVVVAVVASQPAVADLLDVRVDFNTASGDPAGNWNVIDDAGGTGGLHSLKDYNTGGTLHGVKLDITDAFVDSGVVKDMTSWSNTACPWINNQKDALEDYMYLHDTPNYGPDSFGQITISGLGATKLYKVELLAAYNGSTPGDGSEYEVNEAYADASLPSTTSASSRWYSKQDGYDKSGVMIWSSVSPSSNKITIDVTLGDYGTGEYGYDRAHVNGLRISEVPEPSTLVLLGIGALALLLVRRRRK